MVFLAYNNIYFHMYNFYINKSLSLNVRLNIRNSLKLWSKSVSAGTHLEHTTYIILTCVATFPSLYMFSTMGDNYCKLCHPPFHLFPCPALHGPQCSPH